MEADKRKIERFAVRGGAFAGLGRGLLTSGLLRDISTGGLSFEYLYDEKLGQNADYVNIWMTGDEFSLREVPCEKVYDKSSPQNIAYIFPTSTIMRRCGVKFGALSTEQSEKLSSFINVHTQFGTMPHRVCKT